MIPFYAAPGEVLEGFLRSLCGAQCVDCGSLDCDYQPCPYASEINGDDEPVWLCEDCAYERAQDI